MEEPKTLSYDWQYGREELFLRVDSYMSDDNLYIGLYYMEDGYPESFADLTVNLPFAPLGGINEAYIDHNFSKEKLRFIKQHKLGTIQPDTASSGYCIFQRVAFDLKKLAELDPEGTKRFMERNGIRQRDVPKQKQKKKVQLLIDEDVMKEPYFGCHPCINTSSLKFTTEDLMQKIIPALEHEPVTVTLPVPE